MIHINGEAMLLLHRFEQDLQQVMLTLFHPTATPTHQVVMRLIVGDFVIHLPAPVHGVNQAYFTQKV